MGKLSSPLAIKTFSKIKYCGSIQLNVLSVLIIVIWFTSCHRIQYDNQYTEIARLVNESPTKALSVLDTIERNKLSERENAFINLMTIKAQNKAGIKPTSDSLIKDVVKHYKRDWSDGLYFESLFWAGKVYSDLGDYPTSLHYFQGALSQMPNFGKYIILKREILSNIAGLYQEVGLYKETIQFVSEVKYIDSTLNSQSSLVEDHIKMAEIYLLMRDFAKADSLAQSVTSHFNNLPLPQRNEALVVKAASSYMQHDNEAALDIVRKLNPDSIPHDNLLYEYVPDIYLRASIADSAYLFAHRLTISDDTDAQIKGYETMLSPSLRRFIPSDSLESFFSGYKEALENQVKAETVKGALLQNAYYNYTLHDREKAVIARENLNLKNLIVSTLILALGALSIVLIIQVRHKNRIIRLQAIISDLHKLNESISTNNIIINEKPAETSDESLKEELKSQLLTLSESSKKSDSVSAVILKSSPYQELLGYLVSEKPVPVSNSQIWTELEKVVSRSSKNFKPRLRLLLGEQIEEPEMHLALLIKCGFSPSNAAILLGRSRSTISYRRAEMCSRLLGKDFNPKDMDKLIRVL